MTDTAFDVVYQDIQGINSRMADVQRQLAAVTRLTSNLKMEEAASYKDREAFLLHQIGQATTAMQAVARALSPHVDSESFHVERVRPKRSSCLPEVIALSEATQEKVDNCPCGDQSHYGILFHTSPETVTRCPRSWWVSLSHLAYENGMLRDFVDFTPMKSFMKEYSK